MFSQPNFGIFGKNWSKTPLFCPEGRSEMARKAGFLAISTRSFGPEAGFPAQVAKMTVFTDFLVKSVKTGPDP